MSTFILDFWMDGYEDPKEMEAAALEFIYDRLNMTASSVKVKLAKGCEGCPVNMQACTDQLTSKRKSLFVGKIKPIAKKLGLSRPQG